MNTSGLRLTSLTTLLAAVGFAVSLAGCASTAGIAPTGDSTLDDVLSRGPVAVSSAGDARPDDHRETTPTGRLVVARIA